MPRQQVRVDTVLKPCVQAKYDDASGLTLGIENIHWEDKLIKFDIGHLPASQKRMLEQQLTVTPEDKFLVFDVYIKNNSNQPLIWRPQNAPLFLLIDKNGTKYNPSGQAEGNIEDISAKVIMGSNINPNRMLKGTTVFDVPHSGPYQLVILKGTSLVGWSVSGGREIMRCIVSK